MTGFRPSNDELMRAEISLGQAQRALIKQNDN